jgi:hypothetical protein
MLETVPLTGLVTLLPPSQASGQSANMFNGSNPITVNGRTYNTALGSSVQVPAVDAVEMMANGWSIFGWGSGTTAQRPTPGPFLTAGLLWYDTTLSAMICWDGATWRSGAGVSV